MTGTARAVRSGERAALPVERSGLDHEQAPYIGALRDMVFDGQYEQSKQVRRVLLQLGDRAESGVTFPSRARRGYDQLREVVAGLGPSTELAADPLRLFAVFDWAAIAAPDLTPLLSGHFTLTVGAIQRLGNGSTYQRDQLRLLEDAGHVGVFLLTELGYGSNVLELETEAVWDRQAGSFLLTTPTGEACKFMPNVAAHDVPKLTIVAARLKVDGTDQGVFPFIVPLRDRQGLAPGVEVVALPDKGFAPMDNAMIRFDHVRLPRDAWLSGGIARIDDGRFSCSMPPRDRFLRTIEQLQAGRIALSTCVVASARAALALTTRYAMQRRTARGVTMLERDNVQRSLASCAARVYAATALANEVRRRFADPATPAEATALLAILAKPLLTSTVLTVLQECRERCGAQGMFRLNRICDYIGNTQGAITAEGDNQVLQVAAGRLLRQGASPSFLETATAGPATWWRQLLASRQQDLLAEASGLTAATAIGSSSAAIDIAVATADALASYAMTAAATRAEPPAQEVLHTLATVYSLERIRAHASWYTAAGYLTAERAADLEHSLAHGYQQIAAQLPALAAAFAIPDLGAPIHDDYISAWLDVAGWKYDGHVVSVTNGDTGYLATQDTQLLPAPAARTSDAPERR